MMKKSKKSIVIAAVLCLLAALVTGGIFFLTGQDVPDPVPVTNWDTDWYNADEKEFTISTVEQLYGLAELSKTHNFKGQTIKLGADIVINEGDASKWADRAPTYLWNPITGFAGTFDGQGHTISGVYGNSIVTSLGLFTNTQRGCVIKNLNLVNSCFKNNNDMGTGSIIGVGGGVLENVYSDAVLVSAGGNVGGLIGCVKAKGENQIINCWFDGAITMDGYDCSSVGGLVGVYAVEDAINTIAHSLSTADISCMGENVGGICGNVGNGSFLNLTDSMFTGTLEYDTNKYAVVGSVVGQVMSSGSIIVNDSYTVDEIANRAIGTSGGYQKGSAIAVGKNYLLGVGGYQWTTLDFDNYWVAQKDGMPRLRYYTQATESIEGVEKMVDISWYDQTGAAFEITNVQQLYGFAYLSRSYDFRGQIIRLGADITVNEGDASTWGENAPAYNWTPIAWYGSSLSQRFKGTFDGQGHTISGIYAKGTENVTCIGLFGEVYHGAVVKDFKLVNSYFEGVLSADVRGPVGSVAGRLRGTIENVYSDAIVVNSAKNTGGIVGMIIGTGQNTISGCWFDGTIYGITRSGGILGGVYGNKGNIEATIEHCLNTGDIHVEVGQAAVGGICGSVETWSILNINDCLNAGTFQTVGEGKNPSSHIGTLLGTVTETDSVGSKVVITHSYGVKEFYSRLVGWEFEDGAVDQSSMMYTNQDELMGYGGYRWTTLDFDNYWAVRENAVPVPVAFAESRPSVAGHVRMVDYSWYDPNESQYTIYNFQQLYGMARLWEVTNLFKDKTVLLGADITINTGNAADWGNSAPAYEWEPMRFSGTFDGQGHTVSGVYAKGGAEDNYVGFFHRIYQGGAVKNLKLTNSYFEGTMPSSERGAVGSIAGRNNGIIDTVYSDAIVVNSARMTGGLVGMITGEGRNEIRSSWFNGQITGINRTGGILGGVYGNKEDIKVTIADCANTGSIAVKIGSGDVGGICGIAETGGTLTITNCLNAGTFKTVGSGQTANTHIGSVFGSVTQKDGAYSRVVLRNVYGVKEFYSKLIGWSYAEGAVSTSDAVLVSLDNFKQTDGYKCVVLDYRNAWALNGDRIPVPRAFGTILPDMSVVDDLLDYSWYDAGKSEYIIKTPEQLMAFAVLCNTENNYFAGKTVKLGANITLNEGSASGWAAKAPANVWTPINFSGTFDGQGYTISGLYVKSTKQYTGFFSTLSSGAVVKNVKLVNSYIEGNGSETRSGVGSIAGRNHGTIDTVYSNAILKNSKQMTGGIVGMVTDAGENKITNCWFDGVIYSNAGTGGILGSSYGQKVTIEHCLNTGTLNVTSGSQIGGMVGYVQGTANVKISDSLNAGKLTATDSVKQIGTVVGALHDQATLEIVNAYGVSEFAANTVGYRNNGILTGTNYATRALDDIKGYGAYQWMTLDFSGGTWVLKKDAVPALGVFDSTDLDLAHAKTLSNYHWYNDSVDAYVISTPEQLGQYAVLSSRDDFVAKPVTLAGDEYVISTPEQLRGFGLVCGAEGADYFKGKTVKLSADIPLNEGNAADWAEEAPANAWTPVNFSGIFDGQGHTISGLYVDSTKQYTGFFGTVNSGAVVRNVKLVNSYIEGNGPETRSGVGSIAGRSHGTIDTVYSNAILVNSKQMTGGIVGMVTGAGENKIINCWFDGTVYSINGTGGILGSSYGQKATIEHCLNTGTLNVTSGSQIGGLVGYVQGAADVTVSDSLNAGKLTAASGVKQIGAIVGSLHDNAKLKLENSYGVNRLAANAVGYCDKGTLTGTNYAVRALDDIKGYGAYQWMTLDFDGGTWALKKDAVPVLGVFGSTDLDLTHAKTLPTYHWYNDAVEKYTIGTAEQLGQYAALSERDDFVAKPVELTGEVYTISTADQLRGFGLVCGAEGADYFKGKTVKLSADIPLNEGTAADWADPQKAPSNKWSPVNFSGTFDGQGHTVSGLYVLNTERQHTGLFGTVNTGATVKNLKIVNSYIEGAYTEDDARAGVGSIAGQNHGTIDSVYSSAILVNSKNMTGGIAGMVNSGFSGTITNCWFDGQIHGIRGTGGILGGSYAAKKVTIEHCLNTGTLNVADNTYYVGGIAGEMMKENTVIISDSLNAGSLTGTVKSSGAIVGRLDADTALTINDVYAVSEFLENAIGAQSETATVTGSNYKVRPLADIKGYGAYQWTTLDFDGGTWVLKKDAVPVLGLFGSTDLSLDEAKKLPDYTWYEENSNEYVLTTARQLYGFNDLCDADTDYFNGKTVKLGADITLTGGSESAPNWTPVRLKGTFDGQGHTLSGVYIKTTDIVYTGFFARLDGTVQNLRLENSYVEGNGSETRSGVGSIAGRVHGTIDSVYSSVIVKNSKQMTGGIAGMSFGGAISNCWFDGQIIAGTSTGGILGGAYAQTVTIEHCLNTGTITVGNGANYVGGLAGRAQNSGSSTTEFQWTITDSLYAGTIAKSADTDTVSIVGMIVGGIHTTTKLTLNDVYGAKDADTIDTKVLTGNVIGEANGTVNGANYAVRNLADIKGTKAYQWTTLDFETKPYWVMREGKIPVLNSFKGNETVLKVTAAVKALPDYTWYDETADTYVLTTGRQLDGYVKLSKTVDLTGKTVTLGSDEYILTTPDQLLAFNSLNNESATNWFAGKTVKLGADINLNEGADASTWSSTNAPDNVWINEEFKGVFDGQGHTVSGVYVTAGTHAGFFKLVHNGAVVRNLKLVNSYIEKKGDSTSRHGVGSIAGRSYGTIENIYSSAIVKNGSLMTGGIVGMIDASGANKITNCWFDGQINATGSTGGILGGTYKVEATIEHCLNTGTITVEAGTAIGGLCGYAQNTNGVTIRDSLNAGTMVKGDGTIKQVGTIIGAVHKNATKTTVGNVYGVTEFANALYGYTDENNPVKVESGSVCEKAAKASYYGTGAAKLDYTTYWTARDGKTPMLTSFVELANTLGK